MGIFYFSFFIAVVGCLSLGFEGRKSMGDGFERFSCVLHQLIDASLRGVRTAGESTFLGFLPALDIIDKLADNLGNGALRRNVESLLLSMDTFAKAFSKVTGTMDVLEASAAQHMAAQCSLGVGIPQLIADARTIIGSGLTSQLAKQGDVLQKVLNPSQLDVVADNMRSFLQPVINVKEIVFRVVGGGDSQSRDVVGEFVTLGLWVVAAILFLILPIVCCGAVAALRLLFLDEINEITMHTFHHKIFGRFRDRAPRYALITWNCACLYVFLAFVIAGLLGQVAQMAAGACVVMHQLNNESLNAYGGALGLPNSGFVRDASLDLFQACFTQGGAGNIMDAISFDGCVAGANLASGATLRSRLESLDRGLSDWLKSFGQVVTSEALSKHPRLIALDKKLRAISQHGNLSSGNAQCPNALSEEAFWCTGFPPFFMPGLCSASSLANQTALRADILAEDLHQLELHRANITSQAHLSIVQSLRILVFEQVGNLTSALDCSFLGNSFANFQDAVCLGMVEGMWTLSRAHYGLGGATLVLAIVQYLAWQRLQWWFRIHQDGSKLGEDGCDPTEMVGDCEVVQESVVAQGPLACSAAPDSLQPMRADDFTDGVELRATAATLLSPKSHREEIPVPTAIGAPQLPGAPTDS